MAHKPIPEDPAPYSDSGDPIRDGIQKRLIDEGNAGLIVHYAVVAGVSYPTDNGWKTQLHLYTDEEQPDYVTEILLMKGEELRDEAEMAAALSEDEDEETS